MKRTRCFVFVLSHRRHKKSLKYRKVLKRFFWPVTSRPSSFMLRMSTAWAGLREVSHNISLQSYPVHVPFLSLCFPRSGRFSYCGTFLPFRTATGRFFSLPFVHTLGRPVRRCKSVTSYNLISWPPLLITSLCKGVYRDIDQSHTQDSGARLRSD